jgi:hypothetical protein
MCVLRDLYLGIYKNIQVDCTVVVIICMLLYCDNVLPTQCILKMFRAWYIFVMESDINCIETKHNSCHDKKQNFVVCKCHAILQEKFVEGLQT